MQGIRFYLEYENKTKKNKATRKETGEHTGNVIAVLHENPIFFSRRGAQREAIGALFSHANSEVCGTAAGCEYLQDNCKRISEKQARDIHPNLFSYLDN